MIMAMDIESAPAVLRLQQRNPIESQLTGLS